MKNKNSNFKNSKILIAIVIIVLIICKEKINNPKKETNVSSIIFKLRKQAMFSLMFIIFCLLIVAAITKLTLESFSFLVAAFAVVYNIFVSYVNSYWNEIDAIIVATQPNSPMLYIEYYSNSRACRKCVKKREDYTKEEVNMQCNSKLNCFIKLPNLACIKNEGASVAKYIRVVNGKSENNSYEVATHMSPQENSVFDYKAAESNSNLYSEYASSNRIYALVMHTDFSQRNIYVQILYKKDEKYKEFRFKPIVLDRDSKFPNELKHLIDLDYFMENIICNSKIDKEPIYQEIENYRREMIV